MDKSKTKIIPVILVWVTFIFNIIFAHNNDSKMIVHKECTYESDSQCSSRRMGEYFQYFFFIIFLLIELIGAILISVSCCNNSYCGYLKGIGLLFIFSVLISNNYIPANENKYTILIMAKILVQWIQMIVLIIYAIIFYCSLRNSYLNIKLVNDYPTQGQSLQPEQ